MQRLAVDIDSDDFTKLRDEMAKSLGSIALKNEINRVRCVFKFAYDHRLINVPVAYGQSFRRPNPKRIRLERREKGRRQFTPEQIKALLVVASVPLKAMILMGINCGFGNADCGQLKFSHVDLDSGWFDFARPKTGIDRRGKLWPETITALRDAITCRPEPKDERLKPLIFITSRLTSWYKDTGHF
jgi:integrase